MPDIIEQWADDGRGPRVTITPMWDEPARPITRRERQHAIEGMLDALGDMPVGSPILAADLATVRRLRGLVVEQDLDWRGLLATGTREDIAAE